MYTKTKRDLVATLISQHLYLCFESQLKLVRSKIYERFEKEALRHRNSKEQVNENFHEQAENAFINAIKEFKKQAANLVVEGSGWGEQVSAHEKDLAFQLRALINNAREKELDKLQSLTLQQAKDRIEQIVNAPIYELNPDFWEEIKTPYLTELRDLATSCDQILKQGF